MSERDNIQVTTQAGILPRLGLIFGDPATAQSAGPVFACDEADEIARFLAVVCGDLDGAATWLQGHGRGDEDPELVDTADRHHGLDEEMARSWVAGLTGQ